MATTQAASTHQGRRTTAFPSRRNGSRGVPRRGRVRPDAPCERCALCQKAYSLRRRAPSGADRVFHFGDVASTRVKWFHTLAPALNPLMSDASPVSAVPDAELPWDARLARHLVWPLRHGPVTPNHLTTVRLGVGVAAAGAFMQGGYAWMNLGALLLVISNFLDHTDGELARMSGKTSRLGHWYDLGERCTGDDPAVHRHRRRRGRGAARGAAGAPACARGLRRARGGAHLLSAHAHRGGGRQVAGRQGSLGGFQTEDVLVPHAPRYAL